MNITKAFRRTEPTKRTWEAAARNALTALNKGGFDIDLWAPGDDENIDDWVRSFVSLAAAALDIERLDNG